MDATGPEGVPSAVRGAVGDGTADDTEALQAALDRLDAVGQGVLDLGGRTYLTGRLSLRPQLGLRNGVLRLRDGANDFVLSLDGHPDRPQRDWLVDRVVIDGNKQGNPDMPGVILVRATGVQFDRPLLRDVRIGNARGRVVCFTSSDPERVFTIQPRLEHVTIDCGEVGPGTVGLAIGPGVFDSSLVSVDIGRCTTGVEVRGTVKHRMTDVRAWGCGSSGLLAEHSRDLTLVNCEFDNNFGDGARFRATNSVHAVATAFTSSGHLDEVDQFGFGRGFGGVRADGDGDGRDGAVLTEGSDVVFTACRFGNEAGPGGGGGRQRCGIRADDDSSAVVRADCTFRDLRGPDTDGAHVFGGRTGGLAEYRGGARIDPRRDTRFDVGFYSDTGAGAEMYRADDPDRPGQVVLVAVGPPRGTRVEFVRSDGEGGFAPLAALEDGGVLRLPATDGAPAVRPGSGALFVRDGALHYLGGDGRVTRIARA